MKKLERAELSVQTERDHRARKPKSLAPILGLFDKDHQNEPLGLFIQPMRT